jgi:hypothetical protein
MLSAVVARHIAGRCPHCNLPTFYMAGRMTHSCLRCGRVYHLGSEGERTPSNGNRIQRRRSQPSPRRFNGWRLLRPRAAAFGVNLTAGPLDREKKEYPQIAQISADFETGRRCATQSAKICEIGGWLAAPQRALQFGL